MNLEERGENVGMKLGAYHSVYDSELDHHAGFQAWAGVFETYYHVHATMVGVAPQTHS